MLRELPELREDAAALAGRLARLRLARAAGLSLPQTLRDALQPHRLATSAEGLAQVREALAEAEGEDPKRPGRISRLSSLREFLVEVRAIALEPGAAQDLFELPRRARVRPPGDAGLQGALPPVVVERELPSIAAREKRADMERALAQALAPADGARSAAWGAAQSALVELGSTDPAQAALSLHARGWSAQPARDASERILRETEAVARDLGGWLLERQTGVGRQGAERHDVLRLLHAPRCAPAFPAGELLRTVRRWAAMLGLDLSADGCVSLDDEDRPLKQPGAHAEPVDPPHEVRVTVLVQEGPRALGHLLGAISVAHLRAGPPDDAPPEDLWLGDPAVPHACGALLESLVRDPGFLRRAAHADLSRDDERAIAIAGVIDARLAAARTLASLEAHQSGLGSRTAAAVRELYAVATGASLPDGLAFAEVDPFLAPWGELRGQALAARLRLLLREKFDEDWWRNPRALSALHALWARGGRPTAVELWTEAGGEPSVAPLSDELIEECR